jgi:gamma-glutamylcyclotransferase (GGCT)/AIG2-like uncharacterized protein YtfP
MSEFIFVYGTLRRGANHLAHDAISRHADYYGEGYMQGKLYDVGDYPAAIETKNENDKAYGEVYKISDNELLTQLDIYEECSDDFPQPHEYTRNLVLINVNLPDKMLEAWAYIFNYDVSVLRQITSGDYLKRG